MPVVVATAFRAPQSGVRRGRGPRAQGGGWAHWRLSRPLTGRRSSATGKAPPPRFLTCIRPDSSLITRAVGERSPLESLKPRPLRLGEASYGAGENLPGKRAAVVSVLSAHSSAACQMAPPPVPSLRVPLVEGAVLGRRQGHHDDRPVNSALWKPSAFPQSTPKLRNPRRPGRHPPIR